MDIANDKVVFTTSNSETDSLLDTFKSSPILAKSAIISIAVVCCINVLAILFLYGFYTYVKTLPLHEYVNIDELNDPYFEGLYGVTFIEYLFYSISAILFLTWTYRIYNNFRKLSSGFTYKSIWIILGWITPIVNLYIPQKIYRKMAHEVQSFKKKTNLIQLIPLKDLQISFWWFIIIIHGLLSYISSLMFVNSEKNEQLMYSLLFIIISKSFFILSGVLLIGIVHTLSKNEKVIYNYIKSVRVSNESSSLFN